MTYSVAVSGASGYAGGEILRLLADHPDFEVRTVTAHSNAGQPLVAVQPHLRTLHAPHAAGDHGRDARRPRRRLPRAAARGIRCHRRRARSRDPRDRLRRRPPARAARRLGGVLRRRLPRRVDATAFPSCRGCRARSATGSRGRAASPPRAATRRPSRSRSRPGIRAGVIEDRRPRLGARGRPVGRGQEPARRTCSRARSSARRTRTRSAACTGTSPRSRRRCGGRAAPTPTISFTPVLVPMSRGILATSTARIVPGTDAATVRAAWEDAYAGERFVQLLPDGPVPAHGRRARREHRAHGPRGRRDGGPGRRRDRASTTS